MSAGTDARTEVPRFDVLGPLPAGTTVLEASAGTGKTWTIAALALRYVAEGHAPLSRLMLVTFGRMATSELRDRVRARFVEAERALRAPAVARDGDDPVLRLLAEGTDGEVSARHARVAVALTELDAATIATTHGFCERMLAVLGTASGVDRDTTFVPDVADLVDEVVDDLYLRKYAASPDPTLSVDAARTVARAAVSDHDAELRPLEPEAGSAADHRVRLARAVRTELEARKRARHLLDYDDLLTLLRAALTDPVTGGDAAQRVRDRYDVVMVDEFQDTDRVQWDILRTAFHGHRTLVLIGDPKQAIYAFRGADVVTYLSARREADALQTLGVNWRADGPLQDGLRHLLGATALGDPRIVVHDVRAARAGRRLHGQPPVRVRQVLRAAAGADVKPPPVDAARAVVYADVAAQVVEQLRTLELGTGPGRRPLRPGDVAVLTRRNKDAVAVRDALADAGVPAVVSAQSSVFATRAARQWLTLLSALAQPGVPGRVAAAALTSFVGWDAAQLALAGDEELDALTDRVRSWAALLAGPGVASVLEAAVADGMTERLLRRRDGERVLTDLRHIGEALHGAARAEGMGGAALTEWLRARIDEAEADYAEERSRRLETDAEAVQVITVHASKGLEFPVVHVPFGWTRWADRRAPVWRYHDGDERLLHVGGEGDPSYAAARDRALEEDLGEDLRLAYVALTRASSQAVLWWAPSTTAAGAAMTRLLLGGRDADGAPPASVPTPPDEAVRARLAALASASGGTVVHEVVEAPPDVARWSPPAEPPPELHVARLRRRVDTGWRRLSYSGLTAAAHDAGSRTEPEEPGTQDEPPAPPADALGAAGTPAAAAPVEGGGDGPDPFAQRSPLADLPAGTTFGTLTHLVLEHVDTGAADLDAELLQRCQEATLLRGAGVDPRALAHGLGAVLRTPLGPLAGGRTLADVYPRDRLPELEFELPLAGGDTPGPAAATVREIGALLRRHLPAGDPFAGYAARLEDPLVADQALRGYLTGSIDAVLRVPGPGGDERYLVVDYKTNRLAPPDVDLLLAYYRPDALVRAMLDAHYPLQLLLYAAALHRYLRWRRPGYDPDAHLGGALYLFVRGMAGPTTPAVDGTPCGVLGWRPPTALVTELSDLLDGRPR
ncbi:UvrD-helicase domain-containing protein [Cellulomonas massiliensis]|uniref:UvrD-helicase domain-containing protein n=1 Tax=Cellulomonas massiliensis TaxID=1465811 RepID=UPI0011CC2E7D|nr:UvrD-helicase domain-containing protein [Cellulomonas massiliensis]